ncbi:MAG: response regulator [Clostridia bacterium]|nr:response regulator [Clostridia bacterium]
MKLSDTLRKTCKELHVSMSELARNSGQTPQNLSMKLKRDTLSYREFCDFMSMMGVQIHLDIVYPDGKKPEVPVQDPHAADLIDLLQSELTLERRKAEYQKKLNTDMRTALYNIQGYMNLAGEYASNAGLVNPYFEKLKTSYTRLNALLGNTITYADVSGEDEEREENKAVIGRRVLLAEDEPMNAEITATILREKGMLVEVAGDGAAAVNMVANAEPGYYDCVLMDIIMPEMDGYKATKQIRDLPNRVRAGIPVIAMTANSEEADKKAAKKAGMDDYIVKPVDSNYLVSVIAKYL